jgi:NitT/TauT family transport system ATP-binding protein
VISDARTGAGGRIVPVALADRDVTSPTFNEVKREIAELVHSVPAPV